MRDLPQKAEKIVAALREYGGQANTREIREWSGISAALISHHSSALQDAGLVEKVGMKDTGEPALATVYALTDEGERIGMAISDVPPRDRVTLQLNGHCDHATGHGDPTNAHSDRLDDIEARIGDLEEKVDHAIRLLEVTLDET